MTTLLTQIMDSTTCRECDRIVQENIELINPFCRRFFTEFANNRKRHIVSLQRMKKQNWSIMDKN